MRRLKKLQLAVILIVAVFGFVFYLLRGGFRHFEVVPYKAPASAFTNWDAALDKPSEISLVTAQDGVVHVGARLNLDPASPQQRHCDHTQRDLAVLTQKS